MSYILLKTLITAVVVVAISEIARRSVTFAAVIAALPLTSILAFIWIYTDTGDLNRISSLSAEIFWLVIPTLLFFVLLPLFLKYGVSFWFSLISAGTVTVLFYGVYFLLGKKYGLF